MSSSPHHPLNQPVNLFHLGGEVLRAFAFTLFFGIIIGTYSSVFVASAFVLEYATKRKKKVQFS